MNQQQYIQEVLRDQPAGFWPLNELPGTPGAFARDYRPTNAPNPGIYNGAYILGQPGPTRRTSAWLGDGSTTSITCGQSSSLQPASVTFECWITLASTAGVQIAMINRTGNAEASGVTLFCYNGFWQFWATDDQQNWTTLSCPAISNAWSHLAITADGSTLRGYLNGQCVAATSLGTPAWDPSGSLVIGSDADGSSAVAGSMAFAAVYASALSPSRIAAHYTTMLGRSSQLHYAAPLMGLHPGIFDYYRRKRAA